jgi:hypothetical protein
MIIFRTAKSFDNKTGAVKHEKQQANVYCGWESLEGKTYHRCVRLESPLLENGSKDLLPREARSYCAAAADPQKPFIPYDLNATISDSKHKLFENMSICKGKLTLGQIKLISLQFIPASQRCRFYHAAYTLLSLQTPKGYIVIVTIPSCLSRK